MLNAGSFGVAASRYGNFTLQQSDLLLCLGMRLSAQIVGGDPKKFSPNSKKILVDIDNNDRRSPVILKRARGCQSVECNVRWHVRV